MSPPSPVFGKRNAPRMTAVAAGPAPIPASDHAAFFAAARAELTETPNERTMVVPFSFKAAFLAGLVVGCGLVGFDLTGSGDATRFTSALGLKVGGSLMPAMILLGLVGGARTVAINLVMVHWLLGRMGLTNRLAYALGGATAAACLALALLALAGHAPTHGWATDLLAGAAGGFLYRMFAGTRQL